MEAHNATAGHFGDFCIDPVRRCLRRGSTEVALRPRSFDVLLVLVRAAGRPVSKGELMQAVWPEVVVTEDSLTRCISDIRQSLDDRDQRVVKTLPRKGYMLAAPVRFDFPAPQVAVDAATTVPASTSAPHAGRRRWLLASAAVLAGASIAALAWYARPEDAAALSIAVLPLAVLGGDAREGYLAEGITEDLTTDLSRIPGAFVVARSSAQAVAQRVRDARDVGRELGVRYLLEGGVQRVGATIHLNVRLVETGSRRELWAERFEAELDDLAGLQQRVTGTLARSLHLELLEAESRRARSRVNPDAHDLTLRAWSAYERRTPPSVAQARALLLKALEIDPDAVLALSLLADTYTADLLNRWLHMRSGATREEWLRRADGASRRAYALEADSLYALGARATVLQLQGWPEEGLAMLQRQLALNRNYAPAWHRISYAWVTLGRPEEALKAGEEALRLSPHDGRLYSFYVVMAAAHLHAGRDAEARKWARKSVDARPEFGIAYAWLAAAAAQAGDEAAAREAIDRFIALQPGYTVASFRNERQSENAEFLRQRQRFYDGLLRAGLPAS
jgi:TolB-like protein/DNA-binding winged helix-turn-helix (wHTH) protein/tetratricopeptide (TPR) repeat protein